MHMKYTMDRTNLVENIQINVHLLKYYFEYPWRRTNEVFFKHYHIVKEIAITVFENEVIYANIKKMVTNLKVLHKSIILMLGICASGKHKYFDKLMFRQIFTCLKFCFSGVFFFIFYFRSPPVILSGKNKQSVLYACRSCTCQNLTLL